MAGEFAVQANGMEFASLGLGILSLGISAVEWMDHPIHTWIVVATVCGALSVAVYLVNRRRSGLGGAGAICGGMGLLLRVLSIVFLSVQVMH